MGREREGERRAKVPFFIQFSVIIIVLVGVYIGYQSYQNYQNYQNYQRSQAQMFSLPSNAAIVTEVQHMSKLETVSYTLQQVVAYDPYPGAWWNFLGDPKKLFIVYGTVTAGMDLSTLNSSDIITQKQDNKITAITLIMPDSKILGVAIDPTRTKIYDMNSGLLPGLWNQNIDPTTTVSILAGAQKSLQSEACQNHILQEAADSAKTQLTSFLKTVGFPSVTVNISAGTCS